MALTLGVLSETHANESRVALVPEVASKFMALGVRVLIQSGAGGRIRIPDAAFSGCEIVDSAAKVLSACDVLLKVNAPTLAEAGALRPDAVVVGFMQAHRNLDLVRQLCDGKVTSFAMELVPRISRAQSMDALSSQAAVAGYKAVLMAANTLGKFFPMLTTAAGTIRPAQVLIIGAGVAGLQAIATARRLGAVVEAYDVRSATREQVESLGARFVDTGVSAEGEGGYARELTAEEKQQQQDALAKRIAVADVIITTAAIPGRSAPRIISKEMVAAMKPGSVILDMAAEGGGNCELTRAGETVEANGVLIEGPINLPARVGWHASDMYARNLLNFLKPAISDGELCIDWSDEVFAQSALTHAGEVRHQPTRELLQD